MRHNVFLLIAIIIWLGTFLLLIPCTGLSCTFALWSIHSVQLPFRIPGGELTLILSYYISLIAMIIASGVVIMASPDHRQALKRVIMIDLIALAISLLLLFSGANFLPR